MKKITKCKFFIPKYFNIPKQSKSIFFPKIHKYSTLIDEQQKYLKDSEEYRKNGNLENAIEEMEKALKISKVKENSLVFYFDC